MELKDKTAVVTGGNSGIGKAVCEALGKEGVRVAVAGRNAQKCEQVADDIRRHGGTALPVSCDVADPDQVADLFKRVAAEFGSVDILINNAGLSRGRDLLTSTPDDWKTVMDTNLGGSFYCSHEAYPLMQEQGGGHIIMLASQAAGWPGAGELVYGTSKTAQVKLMLHILDEFSYANKRNGQDGDTFFTHAVCPGCVDTPWYDGTNMDRSNMLKAEEVADLVLEILKHPEEPRSYFEGLGKPYNIGPVSSVLEEHPNIIRTWRE